jgi:hypothetical protein
MTREITGEDRRLRAEAQRRWVRMVQEEHDAWVKAGCPDVEMAEIVRWVMNSILCQHPTGAPCPGARGLLGWAKKNREEFYRTFVVKLMPSGVPRRPAGASVPEEDESAAMEFVKSMAARYAKNNEPGESHTTQKGDGAPSGSDNGVGEGA